MYKLIIAGSAAVEAAVAVDFTNGAKVEAAATVGITPAAIPMIFRTLSSCFLSDMDLMYFFFITTTNLSCLGGVDVAEVKYRWRPYFALRHRITR